jgi:16S rRNA (cytosine967-C5)-methyltransferase
MFTSRLTSKATSRHAAYQALLNWHYHGTFLWDSLQKWKEEEKPPTRELNFAYELACGTMRQLRLCDYVASLYCKKLPAKPKERMLLRLAIYQKLFLQNIPAYAVTDSAITLAKQSCHASFVSFLNAFLRNYKTPTLDTLAPGIRYSYPDFFVDALISQYGMQKAIEIFQQGNSAPLQKTTQNPFGYIQNKTQYELISQLAKHQTAFPNTILDMCAAPGGKTLSLHALFPNAHITANDSSASRLELLKENLKKFSCHATVLNSRAQDLKPKLLPSAVIEGERDRQDVNILRATKDVSLARSKNSQIEYRSQPLSADGSNLGLDLSPVDLVVVDAPCSNSGVLYKCPEARWRLSQEEIEKHTVLQQELLEKAYTLALAGKTIWYMTCSILTQENEHVIQQFSTKFSVRVDKTILQLPDNEGHEGGFGCQISILN